MVALDDGLACGIAGMIVLTNAYEGRSAVYHQSFVFDDEREKLDFYQCFSGTRRIGVWRIRPKTQEAFQQCHLRACMS